MEKIEIERIVGALSVPRLSAPSTKREVNGIYKGGNINGRIYTLVFAKDSENAFENARKVIDKMTFGVFENRMDFVDFTKDGY